MITSWSIEEAIEWTSFHESNTTAMINKTWDPLTPLAFLPQRIEQITCSLSVSSGCGNGVNAKIKRVSSVGTRRAQELFEPCNADVKYSIQSTLVTSSAISPTQFPRKHVARCQIGSFFNIYFLGRRARLISLIASLMATELRK